MTPFSVTVGFGLAAWFARLCVPTTTRHCDTTTIVQLRLTIPISGPEWQILAVGRDGVICHLCFLGPGKRLIPPNVS